MLSDFERVLDQVELESKVKFVILVLSDIEGEAGLVMGFQEFGEF